MHEIASLVMWIAATRTRSRKFNLVESTLALLIFQQCLLRQILLGKFSTTRNRYFARSVGIYV